MTDWASRFDVGYAARQVTIVTAVALAPAVIWTALNARRLLVLFVAPGFILTVGWLLCDVLETSDRMWSHSALPYVPFKVGPSIFTVRELVWWFAITLWLPSLLGLGVLKRWRTWRAAPPCPNRAIVVRLVTYMVLAAVWTSLTLVVCEYDHEDTVAAGGFSVSKWRQLKSGMSRREVHELLGPPLEGHCQFTTNAECWVSNYSAGHFAAVWFEGDRATRIQRWYSD
jgi:hypothetical protein